MTTIPAPRKTAVARAKKRTYSTSEARANFAEALGRVSDKNTVTGFDRYGVLVAALVSIDAVRMLAGRGEDVDRDIRDKIERMARIVLLAAPLAQQSARAIAEEGVLLKEEPNKKRKGGRKEGREDKEKRDKSKKKKKPVSARSKSPPRIRRKI